MKVRHIVSLGGNCEVAHHLRRRFGVTQAMPMDWWIVPFPGAVALLDRDFTQLFDAASLQVVGDGVAVQCARTGVVHHHDFRRDAQSRVVAHEVEAALPALREKVAALARRLSAACDRGPVLFVRAWREILHVPPGYPVHLIAGVPDYDFESLLDAVARRWPRIEFTILFVNYGPQRCADSRALFADVEDRGDVTGWTGSATGWDALFDRLGVALEPAD